MWRLASLRRVLVESRVPRLQRYYQDAPTPDRSSRLASVRVARRYHALLAADFVSPLVAASETRGLELLIRYSGRNSAVETIGPPKFLGNPDIHLLRFFDPGRTARRLPERGRHAAPAKKTTKAPTYIPLSRLNCLASGLAVYASQQRLPARHARLASGCWLGFAEWTHTTGFQRKVSAHAAMTPPPSPSFAWRNFF